MSAPAPKLIGALMPRIEDPALITGRGVYAGDPVLPSLASMVIIRSPIARGRIKAVRMEPARGHPGVLAAWAAADLPELSGLPGGESGEFRVPPRPIIAGEVVRYQGEAIAVVIAESPYQAADAASVVEAEIAPEPIVATLEQALDSSSLPIHADLESNVAGIIRRGFGDVESAFRAAAVTVGATFRAARIAGGYLEPRTVTAQFEDGCLTLWTSTQWTFGVRDRLAQMLGLDKQNVRVRAIDVGGGFGPKAEVYPEEVLTALAAMRLRRPVRWVAARNEDTQTSAHGHGTRFDVELAADRDGTLRGLRGRIDHDAGAYAGSGIGQPELMIQHLLSAYHLPALAIEARVAFTNTAPTGFVRGGGRPLGNFVAERLMDLMAKQLGLDPVELRRRNMIQPSEMPYDTGLPSSRVYDGGDYPRLLSMVVQALEDVVPGPRADGLVIGRGIVCCVESSGPGRNEPARVRLERDGRARLFIGSTPQGQGHRTMATQVFAERLGWPIERIDVSAGDTAVVESAIMTAASRSAVQVGNAVALAATSLRQKLCQLAADVLEVDAADLLMVNGRIWVRGTPERAIDAVDVVPEEGIDVLEQFTPKMPSTFPSGCHGAVVSLDPDTGLVVVERYVMAHDSGMMINPTIVKGQLQGGYAHGVGYSLFEEVVYSEDAQIMSGTFLDYLLPAATEIREPHIFSADTPALANSEGFRGAGESGTVPVPAAISSALEQAIQFLQPRARVTNLPMTPERVFKLLHEAD